MAIVSRLARPSGRHGRWRGGQHVTGHRHDGTARLDFTGHEHEQGYQGILTL
jgi:hypothetical protein